MSTPTARLKLLEAAVAKLATNRGVRVSALLREARQRALAGEAAPPRVYDVAELEAAARGTGVRAAMARSRLRLLRDPMPDGVAAGQALARNELVEVGTS